MMVSIVSCILQSEASKHVPCPQVRPPTSWSGRSWAHLTGLAAAWTRMPSWRLQPRRQKARGTPAAGNVTA